MANVIFTPSIFAKLVAMNLGDQLKVVRNLSTQYTKEFGNKTAQVGQTIQAKKPARFIPVSNNLTYSQQDLSQQKFSITVDQTSSIYFGWDSFETTFSLQDINENYARPAAIALASDINQKVATYVAKNTFNAVGAPGVNPNAMLTYLSAKSKLIKQGMPVGEKLTYLITTAMSDAYVDANKALFNNSGVIGKQMETGRVENTLGAGWETDETLYAHTTGAQGGTPLINGGSQVAADGNNGTMSLNIDGLTASTLFAKAGDVFTVSGVFSVHPQTRQSTGELQQFVVLSDATSNGTGAATVTISPAITPVGGGLTPQYANVTAAAADNAAITFWGGSGDANKVSKQGLLLHRDAFAFMSVPFENPTGGVEQASRATDPDTGISVALIRYFDGNARVWKNRFDTCFGIAPLYRELACRIAAGA